MFGYISPVLSVLSEEQRLRYRRVYCGLCRALKRKGGEKARISLSNDMTFLAMLLSSLYEPDTQRRTALCPIHPLHRHEYQLSSMVDYAADMNLLLFYYRCLDQKMDDGSIAGKAGEKSFRPQMKRVEEAWPKQARAVREALEELWQEEKAPHPNPDRLCNLSGRMLGAAFVPRPEDHWAGELYALGEGLGRFVYWMDATEDLAEDLKKGRFNPLSDRRNQPDLHAFCRETLEMFMAEAAEHFEMLPLEQDLDLMRNVLYSGVWQRLILMEKKAAEKKKGGGKDSADSAGKESTHGE